MGRIIIDPRAALFNNTERQVPTSYGRSTLADINAGLDVAGKGLGVAQMAGEIAGPIVVGLGNMGVEDKVKQAQAGLLDLQRNAAEGRSAAARQMMADTQPRNAPAVRRDMEEALPLSVVGEQTPAEMPTEMPSMMRGMMQPGYKNPYRLRFDRAGDAERDARARAAELMLGRGSFGQEGKDYGPQDFDQQPGQELDWNHYQPTDRRSVEPKSPFQPSVPQRLSPRELLRGLPPQELLPGMSDEEVLPPGMFNAPQRESMPQPGTPEFRAMIAQQMPTTETMSAGGNLSDRAMNVLRRFMGGNAPAPAAKRRPAAPSLQQRADVAQRDVAQEVAQAQQQAQTELAPAQAQVAEGVAQSEQSAEDMRRRMESRQPGQAETALSRELEAAQNRPDVQVEDFDYSIPQLEALIIQAKQSGDPNAINRVADAINNSSLRGARAQSVFGDILGGGHLGRERQRLLANLTGVTAKQPSAADLASDLSKATYQRILGDRMEDKPIEYIGKRGIDEGKLALQAGKAGAQVRRQAASAVASQETAQKAATEAALRPSEARASIAQKYASANQANQNAKRIRTLTPLNAKLLQKKIDEVPREGKGINFTFNGGKGSDKDASLFRKMRDEVFGDVVKLRNKAAATPIVGKLAGMDRKQAAAFIAKMNYKQRTEFAEAVAIAKTIKNKLEQLGDASIGGIRLSDSVGLDAEMMKKLEALESAAPESPQVAPAAEPAPVKKPAYRPPE